MRWRRRSSWIYTGLGLFAIALFLMVMRYLGVVFETNAKAQLALHGSTAGVDALLHLAAICNWVRWRWIANLLLLASAVTIFGLGRDWWTARH
ncbi:hypothetical protein HFU84_12365 [Acidithiobacillus sp. CV18-2]|uniref:Uncharacterized protein n=1 Tax=Igneacidithiobacillus copahuensis TaxID=2724909 RepID=A0AAE3CJ52_9PROT|nr:hypothetical protein [Igneacidithiobacillus copahuensis]MBU2754429.1 hypothetical protein [Acidithiobacillus sp. CV18-3]MBU2757548.1 hypothetical protein [Acidithiobacillus sp. BN09-2]MBU2778276.1 hypothetical protein [Acidithiobacillus sp. CV18-2]MBU2797450.1 hypothetical protein [Acidithiobacillus sp. VAN18-2]MBU2799712.1 hypothetical protein [Acidithiobacillus sp. VAN18-4]UTV81880.1 hypothetical protein MQE22_04435 [Acidithiobacillus sp. YTS05]